LGQYSLKGDVGTLAPFLSLLLYFLSAMKWAALFHHVLPHRMSCLTTGPKETATWPWTESSEAVSQTKLFLHVFYYTDGKLACTGKYKS
jgi:hypothetical protein